MKPPQEAKLFEKLKDVEIRNPAALALVLGGSADTAARTIAMYSDFGKDSLDDLKAAELWRRFGKRIRPQFGIGTYFSNDLGPRALSNVIKLVRVGGYPVCKLGDDPAKAQAGDEEYLRYVRHLVTEVMPRA